MPNGNPIDTDKYEYKKKWLDKFFTISIKKTLSTEFKYNYLAGDFNIIPDAKSMFMIIKDI